jgi:hypothetical protein
MRVEDSNQIESVTIKIEAYEWFLSRFRVNKERLTRFGASNQVAAAPFIAEDLENWSMHETKAI